MLWPGVVPGRPGNPEWNRKRPAVVACQRALREGQGIQVGRSRYQPAQAKRAFGNALRLLLLRASIVSLLWTALCQAAKPKRLT